MRYSLAIFDMDGTILDTLTDLTNATNYALGIYGMPERSMAEVRGFVGNGIHKLIERAVLSGTSEDKIEEVYKTFSGYYKDHCAISTRPYEDIIDILVKLKSEGIKLAVVSNKADYAVKSLCMDYFDGIFDYSLGDKEGARRKPYPDGVNEVLEFFDISRDNAVYIGDSEVDYQTAQNADMDCVMVTWGFRDESVLRTLGAKVFANSAAGLMEIILNDR